MSATRLEELAAQRAEINASLTRNTEESKAARLTERLARRALEIKEVNAKLDDEDYGWRTEYASSSYVLGVRALRGEAVFTITEHGDFREEVVAGGDSLIALRDYLIKITA
jgi:hypothetical protein